MKKTAILVMTILFLAGCQNNDNKGDSYYLEDYHYDEDCTVYKMIFYEGNYLFRFATSGRCVTLTADTYVEYYASFLQNFLDSTKYSRSGIIIIEYNENLKGYETITERILKESKLKIGKRGNVKIIKNTNGRMEINISIHSATRTGYLQLRNLATPVRRSVLYGSRGYFTRSAYVSDYVELAGGLRPQK